MSVATPVQRCAVALVCLAATFCVSMSHAAGDAKVTPLMKQQLTGIEGKDGTMITVEYAPGGSSKKHRHNAHVFVYVLEGSVIMQVEGSAPVTLAPGDTFYESPTDVHAVSKNASTTKPAKFVVFMVKDSGAPPTVPVQ